MFLQFGIAMLVVGTCTLVFLAVHQERAEAVRAATPIFRLPQAEPRADTFRAEFNRPDPEHPYWKTLVRRVPPACMRGVSPSPLDATAPRLTLLPGFFAYMEQGSRPRVLVVDESECRRFAVAQATSDGESADAVVQRALSTCSGCSIAVLETVLQHPFQAPALAYPALYSRADWTDGPMHFPEVRELLDNFADIDAEFDHLLDIGALMLHPEKLAMIETDWRVFTLWSGGHEHTNNTAVTPKTSALWRRVMERWPRTSKMRFGLVYFSVLAPGAKLFGHFGTTNMRLRHHLGLRVPDGASITLNHETLLWRRGSVISFDDSYGHEVQNKAATGRAVLICDIWHPELRDEERQAIIDHYDTPTRAPKALGNAPPIVFAVKPD